MKKPTTKTEEVKAPNKIRLMSKHEVLDVTGLSFPTIWMLMQKDQFPRSRDVVGRAYWLANEVEEWITSRPIKRIKGDPDHVPSKLWSSD